MQVLPNHALSTIFCRSTTGRRRNRFIDTIPKRHQSYRSGAPPAIISVLKWIRSNDPVIPFSIATTITCTTYNRYNNIHLPHKYQYQSSIKISVVHIGWSIGYNREYEFGDECTTVGRIVRQRWYFDRTGLTTQFEERESYLLYVWINTFFHSRKQTHEVLGVL